MRGFRFLTLQPQLVIANVDDTDLATDAVLGPMRMHYERVMGAVLQTCRALETAHF